MKLPVTLYVGQVRPLPESGRPSGIYKAPVSGPIWLDKLGFSGDEQADLRVHGGPEKAVHLYPRAHYAQLAAHFPSAADALINGSLGENISADLTEAEVRVGDIWQLGDARLQVCQPRNPCWKIDERFACDGMAAFIAEHRLNGWYWRVLTPGQVAPDDLLVLESIAPGPSLAEALQCWQEHRPDPAILDTIAAAPGIASGWRQKLLARTDWLRQNPSLSPPRPTTFHVKPD